MNCINFVVPMNPCRCGYYPDQRRCTCTSRQIRNYLHKISQPMLDRMDLCVETTPLAYQDLGRSKAQDVNESSRMIRRRIVEAQKRQNERYREEGIFHNSGLTPALIEKYCALTEEAEEYLKYAFEKMELSARVYHKLLKVGRTIADLAGEERIHKEHIAEAVCCRMIDKKYWGA